MWSSDPSELLHLLHLHLLLHLHWMLRCWCLADLLVLLLLSVVLVARRIFFQGMSAARYRMCRVLSSRVPQVMGWTQGLKKTRVLVVP